MRFNNTKMFDVQYMSVYIVVCYDHARECVVTEVFEDYKTAIQFRDLMQKKSSVKVTYIFHREIKKCL